MQPSVRAALHRLLSRTTGEQGKPELLEDAESILRIGRLLRRGSDGPKEDTDN